MTAAEVESSQLLAKHTIVTSSQSQQPQQVWDKVQKHPQICGAHITNLATTTAGMKSTNIHSRYDVHFMNLVGQTAPSGSPVSILCGTLLSVPQAPPLPEREQTSHINVFKVKVM